MVGRALIAAGSLIGLLALTLAAASRGSYPSVGDLQAQLGLYRGAVLPKTVVTPDGRKFQPVFLAAHEHASGRYTVDLWLQPMP